MEQVATQLISKALTAALNEGVIDEHDLEVIETYEKHLVRTLVETTHVLQSLSGHSRGDLVKVAHKLADAIGKELDDIEGMKEIMDKAGL